MLTKNVELVNQLKEDYTKANIDAKTRAMLEYAVRLTIKPSNITDEEINILRNHGCIDREILDVCQITSYFNFVNRMAEGLGVELEAEYK